jgi:hypothetical protein
VDGVNVILSSPPKISSAYATVWPSPSIIESQAHVAIATQSSVAQRRCIRARPLAVRIMILFVAASGPVIRRRTTR